MRTNFSIGLAAIILCACGGGGGDSGGGLVTGGPLALNSGNYVTAAQETMSVTFYMDGSGGLVTGAQAGSAPHLLRNALANARRMGHWLELAPQSVTGATITTSESCSGGGSVSLSINDANGNGVVDVGDSIRLVALNCVEQGETMNGAMSVTVTASSGSASSGGNYSMGMGITLENFSSRSATGVSTGNGRMDFTETQAGSTLTTIVQARSVSVVNTIGNASSTRSLSDYTVQSVTTTTAGVASVSLSVNGTFTSTALDSKSLTVSTLRPFVSTASSIYPTSGQFQVTGASGSNLRLTAQAANVLIELDADGNGNFETSISKPWSQLL